ncbi:DUF6207 family protein [Streptomyces sp. NPDC086783]|uniref:DUF6207 family protein n=1 Tax=Streptomyces sp. NPDC086783 TaxID=3365758 RepID=UPI00382626DD
MGEREVCGEHCRTYQSWTSPRLLTTPPTTSQTWRRPRRRHQNATAFAIQQLLAERCATACAARTTREPDEPGVRLRFFADLRQEPNA